MGFINDEHIKEHMIGKTIKAIERDGNKTWLRFTDGTALRLYLNYGLNSQGMGYYPYAELITTPYGADGEVVMMKVADANSKEG